MNEWLEETLQEAEFYQEEYHQALLSLAPPDNKDWDEAVVTLEAIDNTEASYAWTETMFRDLVTWAEQAETRVFASQPVHPPESWGIRSVALLLSGSGAYSLLREMEGIHTREVLFFGQPEPTTTKAKTRLRVALVSQDPIDTHPDDWEIQTYRNVGACCHRRMHGAIRVRHKPTQLSLTVPHERSSASRGPRRVMRMMHALIGARHEMYSQSSRHFAHTESSISLKEVGQPSLSFGRDFSSMMIQLLEGRLLG